MHTQLSRTQGTRLVPEYTRWRRRDIQPLIPTLSFMNTIISEVMQGLNFLKLFCWFQKFSCFWNEIIQGVNERQTQQFASCELNI